MAYILNIETTTTNCSVSISKNGSILALKEDRDSNYSHAESLHPFIADILVEVGIQKNQLSAVALSEGPGSYTGLRIGTSSAKGICYALDIPLIATSTLQALAGQICINDGFIIPMLDARRKEVYSAVFDHNLNIIREVKAQILNENSFKEYLEQNKVYFIGNANEKASDIIINTNAIFLDPTLPSAREMVPISQLMYEQGKFANVAYFEPLYLKEFTSTK